MERSKSRLIYGLCLVAPVLAGGRPDGVDEGEVHANLPFSLSGASPKASAAAATPARESFSVIAVMSHSAPAMTSAAPATVNTKATSAAAASSVIVIPARPSNAQPEDPPKAPKATPVKYTGQPSIVVVSTGLKSVASAKTPATTPAPTSALTVSKTLSIDDWRTRLTWPPGCEEWANPCPQGAPLIGGGTARTLSNNFVPAGSQSGYVNGFTSFLTMTDANGVVTGMPPKATVPAGVAPSKPGSTVVIVPGKTAASGASSAAAPTPKQSAGGSTPVVSHNGASTLQTAGIALLAGMLGLVATLI